MSNKRGRPADPITSHFDRMPAPAGRKVDLAKCRYCPHKVAWSVANMKTHASGKNCPKVMPSVFDSLFMSYFVDISQWPRSIGNLPHSEVQFVGTLSDDDDDACGVTKSARTTQSITPRWADSMSKADQEHAEELMARAMHRTAERFSIFDNPLWRDFFKFLRPSFRIPGREVIGGRLLDTEYLSIQCDVILAIKEFTTICMTLDGATNKCGKQILNMMGAGPAAFFLEHFQMDTQLNMTTRTGPIVVLNQSN